MGSFRARARPSLPITDRWPALSVGRRSITSPSSQTSAASARLFKIVLISLALGGAGVLSISARISIAACSIDRFWIDAFVALLMVPPIVGLLSSFQASGCVHARVSIGVTGERCYPEVATACSGSVEGHAGRQPGPSKRAQAGVEPGPEPQPSGKCRSEFTEPCCGHLYRGVASGNAVHIAFDLLDAGAIAPCSL